MQHANVKALLEANESLHQQLLLTLQRLAYVYAADQQQSKQNLSGAQLADAREVSEDIARWESRAPALLRADGTLRNDNTTSVEVQFNSGPLGLLFRSAPEDTGYALEVHEFVDATAKRAGAQEQQRQVITQQQWEQQRTNPHTPSLSASVSAQVPAGTASALRRGMVLTSIQGRDVFRVSQDTVGDMLESASRPLTLKFVSFPLSDLRRAYQALQSRFTTLQVRVEVMQSAAQQREQVYQGELSRLKAQLRVMGASWRQASGSASNWERSARRAWAELELSRQQVSSLEKRVPAPQDRLKAPMQREGTAPRGVWSPEGLVRQHSGYVSRQSGHELAGGAFRDLDRPQHENPSFDAGFFSPSSMRHRGSTLGGEVVPPDTPLLRAQSSIVPDDAHLSRAVYAGTAVGDSLLLLKSRLSQLAWERDCALRAMADSQEQLMATQEQLRTAEERTQELQDEVREMQVRSEALARFTTAAEAEQKYQDQYLVRLAQNRFVNSERERPDWNAALVAMRTLWSDFSATLKQNTALRRQLQLGESSHAKLQEALAAVKRKLVALRARKKRSGEPMLQIAAPTLRPTAAGGRPSTPRDVPSRGSALRAASPASPRQAAAPPLRAVSPPTPAPGVAPPPGTPAIVAATSANKPAATAQAAAAAPAPAPAAAPTAGSKQSVAVAKPTARKVAEAAEIERISALAAKLVHGSDVVLEESMFKRSRSGPNKRWSRWVSRFVRLNRGLLSYYIDAEETRPKGTIGVAGIRQVAVCLSGSTGKHQSVFHCFLQGGKEVQLAAASADVCATWRQVLGEATVLSVPAPLGHAAAGGDESDGTDSDASV